MRRPVSGKPIDRRDVYRMVQRIAKATQIPRHISPHSLRHAAITNALDAGVPLRDAQILARHADPAPPSTTTEPAATSTGTASTSSPVTSPEYEPPPAWLFSGVAVGVRHLAPTRFSLYDFCMVTEDQIQKWADEAEAGYDVEDLKRRGRGRPGRGAEPMQVVAVRLTAEELAALDAMAEREHLSRSEAIRRALADFAA